MMHSPNRMVAPRKSILALSSLLVIVLTSPMWGFELLYHYGLYGEGPPQQSSTPADPSLLQEALWLALGETLGAGVEALWAGNYLMISQERTRTLDRLLERLHLAGRISENELRQAIQERLEVAPHASACISTQTFLPRQGEGHERDDTTTH